MPVTSCSPMPAIGQLLTRAAGCVHASRRAGGPGHVLRPTLAGHRFRLTRVAPSTASVRAQVAATANGACARAPSHLPGHRGGMRRRGMPPRMHQGGGGAPGRRPDSRSPPMVAGHSGVDAAADCSLRRPPASVGRRTGAPPPPCRHDVGRLTVRGQTALGRWRVCRESISLLVACQSRRAAMRLNATHIHRHWVLRDGGYRLAKNARVLAPPRPR